MCSNSSKQWYNKQTIASSVDMIQLCPPCESTHDMSCRVLHICRKGTQLDCFRVGNETRVAVLPLERNFCVLIRVHEDLERAYPSRKASHRTGLVQQGKKRHRRSDLSDNCLNLLLDHRQFLLSCARMVSRRRIYTAPFDWETSGSVSTAKLHRSNTL